MTRRILSLWLPRLLTDWHRRRDAALAGRPFVLTAPDRGRVYIVASSEQAEQAGALAGMALADARALEPALHAIDYRPQWPGEILHAMAGWSLRYTPWAAPCPPDGLWLDITGCAHLFGGEDALLADLTQRLQSLGYTIRAGLADTPGAAWAVARYGLGPKNGAGFRAVPAGGNAAALKPLPAAALRLDAGTVALLAQLGLRRVEHLLALPRATLARRFGLELCRRLDQATCDQDEPVTPLQPVAPYSERLSHADGVATADGIAQALRVMLEKICVRLAEDGKGIRAAELLCFRLDGTMQKIAIGTGRPSRKAPHLFRLFAEKLDQIDPGFGIDLILLNASHVEKTAAAQDALLEPDHLSAAALAELDDRLAARLGPGHVGVYIPVESHAPERCLQPVPLARHAPAATPVLEAVRPLHLLQPPEPIDVMALLPDYPPAQFRHGRTLHKIRRAEGPERIEPEWWRGARDWRDYYRLENEQGERFWVFRAERGWFLHGMFA